MKENQGSEVTLINLCTPKPGFTNLVGNGRMSGNKAGLLLESWVGLGMGWVRLGVGGSVVMASSGGDPVLMSELWAAPGLRWRRLVVECQS